jgi:hypothetical protein
MRRFIIIMMTSHKTGRAGGCRRRCSRAIWHFCSLSLCSLSQSLLNVAAERRLGVCVWALKERRAVLKESTRGRGRVHVLGCEVMVSWVNTVGSFAPPPPLLSCAPQVISGGVLRKQRGGSRSTSDDVRPTIRRLVAVWDD